jgi:hypothetical protein
MKRAMMLILALLLTMKVVTAQDDFPPDPSEIFTDAVEVVEIFDPFVNRQNIVAPPQQDVAVANDATRQLAVTYSEETTTYAYPDEVLSVRSNHVFVDTTVWFNVVEQHGGGWVWILDLTTGEFSRFVARCGQLQVTYTSTALTPWVVYTDPYSGAQFLCETATGNLSSILPYQRDWRTDNITASPNGEWLALMAFAPSNNYSEVFIYSYQISTDTLNVLGSLYPEEVLFFERWVGTQILIGTSRMPEWHTRYLYIADAAFPNSLELAVTRFRFWPDYQENPPRYEFITGTEGGDGVPYCSWIIYDIESRELVTHDLYSMCLPDIGMIDGTGYYRDLLDPQLRAATLARFTPLTGEREDLYTGEIEAVHWVSDDEHYAALTLDDSGRIDVHSSFYDPGSPTNPSIALVDLQTDVILYQAATGWLSPAPWISYSNGSYIRRIDENTFLAFINRSNQEHIHLDSYVSRLELVDGQIEETVLVEDAAYITLDNAGIIFRSSSEWDEAASYNLYEIATGNVIPLTQDIDPNVYVLDFHPAGDNLISVEIWRSRPSNNRSYPYVGMEESPRVTYTIRVTSQELP